MRRYDLSPRARHDILALAEHASRYDDTARDVLTDALVDCFERLAEFPGLGRKRPALRPGLRSVPLRRLRVTVFYEPTPDAADRVRIVRVLHQSQNTTANSFGS